MYDDGDDKKCVVMMEVKISWNILKSSFEVKLIVMLKS